jgi:glycerol kinase
MTTGDRPVGSSSGLLTTVGWRLGAGGPVSYALEGSSFVAGAAVQWLRDGLRAGRDAAEIAALADTVTDTGGVYLVPAFVGLGAPYWDAYARGTLIGLTRGTGLAEISRAAIDAMAYQVSDVVTAMGADAGIALDLLRVDGGAARNDRLCQFQADLLGVPVERPVHAETTAIGATALAGLAVGLWDGPEAFAATRAVDRRFEPSMSADRRERLLRGWHRAVERSLSWVEPGG